MTTRARNTDPVTSFLAAEQAERDGTISRQAAEVLAAVERFPGRTSKELSKLSGLDRFAIARRLPELRDAGHLKEGPKRLDAFSRTPALTWEINTREDDAGQLAMW